MSTLFLLSWHADHPTPPAPWVNPQGFEHFEDAFEQALEWLLNGSVPWKTPPTPHEAYTGWTHPRPQVQVFCWEGVTVRLERLPVQPRLPTEG